MSFGFSPDQIRQLMKSHDTDQDGRLTFIDFLSVILPTDYNFSLIKKEYQKQHGLQVYEILMQTTN